VLSIVWGPQFNSLQLL